MATPPAPGAPSPAHPSVAKLAGAGKALHEAHQITADDLFSLSQQHSLSSAPDGSRVAFGQSYWSGEDRRDSLCVIDTSKAQPKTVFDTPTQVFAPQWSGDGKFLYFAVAIATGKTDLAPHSTVSQIWRAEPDRDEVTQLTHIEGGVARFDLCQAEPAIYFSIHRREEAERPWSPLRRRFANALEADPERGRRTELWRQDLTTGEARLVHRHRQFVSAFSIAPDGKSAALVTAPDERLITNEGQSAIELLDLESEAITPIPDRLWREEAAAPHAWIGNPSWSPDGGRLAFLIDHDAHPQEIIVVDTSAASPAPQLVPRPLECHPLRLGWDRAGRLLLTAEHRATVPLISLNPADPDEFSILTGDDSVVSDFSPSAGAPDIAFLQSTPTELPQIQWLTPEVAARTLTEFNAHTASWAFPSLERFSWISPDSTPVEGILELPPGARAKSEPLPLIVNLHGGPNTASLLTRELHTKGKTTLASQGFAVLHPNYRGSAGYGDAFLEGLVGHMNDRDVADVLTGVDALVAEGVADPERLGVMGWSYGGFLTNCLIATGRFRAASSGAAAFDITIQFAEMDTPGHTTTLADALPWENPTEYQRSSPLYSIRQGIQTATLIHAGDSDPRVPATHARALHRVLREYLDAPCELLVYPDAGHQLTTREQQLAKMTWDIDWFDHYLRGQ